MTNEEQLFSKVQYFSVFVRQKKRKFDYVNEPLHLHSTMDRASTMQEVVRDLKIGSDNALLLC